MKLCSFAGRGDQLAQVFVDHSLGIIKAKRCAISLMVGHALSLVAACTTSVGVERPDPQEVWRLGVENGTPGAEGSQ